MLVGILIGGLFIGKIFLYWQVVQKPVLFYGSQESEKRCHMCPSLNRYYYPFFFAWGKNLQLGFSTLYDWCQSFFHPIRWISELCALEDGQDVRIDWADFPLGESLEETPILLILPGGMCDSRNLPGQGWVLEARKKGWLVGCYHPRGTRCRLTISQINVFGSTRDIKYVITHIIQKRRPHSPLFMVGISCGSGLLVRFLGEEGEQSQVTAAVGLCPGYDISVCMNRSDWWYREYLTQRVKQFYMEPHKDMFHGFPGYEACWKARDTQEFLDNAYAMAGYESSETYYQECNPVCVMDRVKTPCFIINSEDDPICVYRNVEENTAFFRNSSHLVLVTTKTGTHCAFWEGFSMKSWAERVAYEFFESVQSCKNTV